MDLTDSAQALVKRLYAAERQCRDRHVNPHREAPTLPVVRELAELVLALTERLDQTERLLREKVSH